MPPERGVVAEPAFEEGTSGRFFRVRFEPAGASARGAVLFVPAFGEEMNRSRHMVAAAARCMAAGGMLVDVPDLYGCGDSDGSLADARVEGWLEDLEQHASQLSARVDGPVHLWGLRSGALLAAVLATRGNAQTESLVLWQPVLRGRQVVTEFLRLRAAASLFAQDSTRETADGLRSRLSAGETLEVAGYPLGSELVAELDALVLAELLPGPRHVHWFEVSSGVPGEPSPAAERVVQAWTQSGASVTHRHVQGPPFWNSAELADCPGLAPLTSAALAGDMP